MNYDTSGYYIIRVPFLYTKVFLISKELHLPKFDVGRIYNYYIPILYSKSCEIDKQRPRVQKFYKTYDECLDFCIKRNMSVDSFEYDAASTLSTCLKIISKQIIICDKILHHYKNIFKEETGNDNR